MKSQSLVIESFSVIGRYLVLGEARGKQKNVVNVSLAFLRTIFWLCEIHSNWAVLVVILNEVEVCPLFAALRACCVHDKTHATL